MRDNISRTLTCTQKFKFNIKRILYLIHEGTGGTLHTSIDLMKKEDQGKNLIGTQEEGLTEKEKLEIKNAKSLIKELTGGNIKKHKLPKEEQKFHTEDEYYHEQLSVTNKKKLPPLKAKRIVNIVPLRFQSSSNSQS